MSDPDIQRVLDFWFSDIEQDTPKIDSRMDRWFGSSEELDREIADQFGPLREKACHGELDHWADSAQGRLALIILLDQFGRNVYRGKAEAYAQDHKALKLCIEGAVDAQYKELTPFQRVFYFMPLQHAESLKVQERSVRIFNSLVDNVSDTLKETFLTFAHFAELHRDIVRQYGRFPHRNDSLNRQCTPQESAYLAGAAPTFGQ